MIVTDETVLEISRTIAAPRHRVWAAWTDPAALARWYCPEGVHLTEAQFDVRPGGAYRCLFVGVESGTPFPFSGRFETVAPEDALGYTHQWDNGPLTRITVTFSEVTGGTLISFRQTGLADKDSAASHRDGWTKVLNSLEAYL